MTRRRRCCERSASHSMMFGPQQWRWWPASTCCPGALGSAVLCCAVLRCGVLRLGRPLPGVTCCSGADGLGGFCTGSPPPVLQLLCCAAQVLRVGLPSTSHHLASSRLPPALQPRQPAQLRGPGGRPGGPSDVCTHGPRPGPVGSRLAAGGPLLPGGLGFLCVLHPLPCCSASLRAGRTCAHLLHGVLILLPCQQALPANLNSTLAPNSSMQILFPESYERTAAWLREQAVANADLLASCKKRLAAAVEAHPRFSQLAGGLEVRRQSKQLARLTFWDASNALVAAALGGRRWRAVRPALPVISTGLCQLLQVHGRTKTLFSTLKKLLRLGNTAAGGRARAQV